MIFLWAILGCVVDGLYRFQGFLFGNDFSFETVAKKVCFDMFVWNPLVGIWLAVLPFHWRTCEFSCTKFWATLTKETLLVTGSASLCTTWAIWLPAVSVVYSLPPDLQVPVFNLILCFSNLILLFVTRQIGTQSADQKLHPETHTQTDIENEMKPLLP